MPMLIRSQRYLPKRPRLGEGTSNVMAVPSTVHREYLVAFMVIKSLSYGYSITQSSNTCVNHG